MEDKVMHIGDDGTVRSSRRCYTIESDGSVNLFWIGGDGRLVAELGRRAQQEP